MMYDIDVVSPRRKSMFVGGEKGSFTLRRQTRNSRSKSEHFLIPSEFYRKVFPSILGSLKL